jgi:hypothetical protein
MYDIVESPEGGYRFIKGASSYSLGVAASPGFRLERVRFQSPIPLDAAFRRMADIVRDAKRPPSALAACELRSPAQLTEAGFRSFNERYVALLRDFGFSEFGEANPVCRTNVCPSGQALPDTCVYAFSYCVESLDARPSFVLAGAVDLMEGDKELRDLIVAPGQVDAAGIRRKASHALDELEGRLSLLGFDWSMTTSNAVHCVHDIYQAVTEEIAARGAAQAGTTWHLCRPPIAGLEFEIDTRSIAVERTV